MRRVALAAVAALILTLAIAAPAQARSADIVNADVTLRLASDGSLMVQEHLTYEYDGHFEGSYRDIELLHGEKITGVSVSTGGESYEPGGNTVLGSHDRPGVYGVDVDEFGSLTRVRIVWHYRATDEVRTYTISYRVEDGAVAYEDVVDVGWTVWGDQWDFDLDRLTASFSHPALDPADPLYRVWGHPREVEGETARGEGIATLEASDVDSGTAVEFRVTLPRSAVSSAAGMRVKPRAGLPDILAEEKALDEDFNAFWPRTKRFIAHNVFAVSLGIAGLAAAAIFLLAWLARERRTSVPEYLPEPPDNAPPALAYALSREGGDSTNTVLATLLDLVDRGYYESSSTTTSDEKLDLAIAVKDDRPPLDDLELYEKEVLVFFDELLDTATVAISDLRDRLPAHSDTWRARWQSMTEELNDAEKGELEFDRDLNVWARLLILVVIAAFVLVTIAYIDVEERFLLPILIGIATVIAIAAVPNRLLRRIDARHRERAAQWTAFAHWTEDFPRLKDDPPQTLELWRRIMVYGVAFGTAERMIKSGRIPAPVMEASARSGSWSSYAFAHSFNFSALNGSTFGAGIASQVAPVTTSSGGGGGGFSGFSGGGGGGGFSGGGGGGSW